MEDSEPAVHVQDDSLHVAGLFARQKQSRDDVDGEKPATLADLSEELEVSRERIRRLQRETEQAPRNEAESGRQLPAAA